jgi:hypothetical protein
MDLGNLAWFRAAKAVQRLINAHTPGRRVICVHLPWACYINPAGIGPDLQHVSHSLCEP